MAVSEIGATAPAVDSPKATTRRAILAGAAALPALALAMPAAAEEISPQLLAAIEKDRAAKSAFNAYYSTFAEVDEEDIRPTGKFSLAYKKAVEAEHNRLTNEYSDAENELAGTAVSTLQDLRHKLNYIVSKCDAAGIDETDLFAFMQATIEGFTGVKGWGARSV